MADSDKIKEHLMNFWGQYDPGSSGRIDIEDVKDIVQDVFDKLGGDDKPTENQLEEAVKQAESEGKE